MRSWRELPGRPDWCRRQPPPQSLLPATTWPGRSSCRRQTRGYQHHPMPVLVTHTPSPWDLFKGRNRREANARERNSSSCTKEIIVKVGRTILHPHTNYHVVRRSHVYCTYIAIILAGTLLHRQLVMILNLDNLTYLSIWIFQHLTLQACESWPRRSSLSWGDDQSSTWCLDIPMHYEPNDEAHWLRKQALAPYLTIENKNFIKALSLQYPWYSKINEKLIKRWEYKTIQY